MKHNKNELRNLYLEYAEHMVQQKRERIENIGGIHLNDKDVGNIINPINQNPE